MLLNSPLPLQASSVQSATQPAHIAAHKYIKDLQHYEKAVAKDNDKDKAADSSSEGEGGAKKPRTDDDALGEILVGIVTTHVPRPGN